MAIGARTPSARTTDTSNASAPESTSVLVHWLVVFRAPEASVVGTRLRAAGLVVGRDTRETFRGDRKLSRRHAELVETDGVLEIVDLGSRNGTRVQGSAITKACLVPGDYVELGSFGFVVARAKELRQLDEDDVLVGDSHAFQKVLAEVRALAASRANAIVRGPSGVGKTTICERIHFRSRAAAALVWLDARASDEMLAATRAPKATVARAENGTLVVECVDEATPAIVEGLPVLLAAAARVGCRVLFTATNEVPATVGGSGTWILEVPGLHERRDDLPALIARCARSAGIELALSSSELGALAMRPYCGNVRELFALVERVARIAPEERVAALGIGAEARPRAGEVRIARDGLAFASAGGARVDLSTSPRLAAVLGALVEAHGTDRGSIDAEVIAQKAWPGERIIPRAARNRVYVAVSSLRKLGLRSVIAHANEGYSLTGSFVVADVV